jgi:hypothetical protein
LAASDGRSFSDVPSVGEVGHVDGPWLGAVEAIGLGMVEAVQLGTAMQLRMADMTGLGSVVEMVIGVLLWQGFFIEQDLLAMSFKLLLKDSPVANNEATLAPSTSLCGVLMATVQY